VNLPAFDAAGQGDTAVLLLHGIGGGRSIWGESGSGTLGALAAAGFLALSLDFPGYGDTPGPAGMDPFVAAVQAAIAHVAPRRVVLVGHSMGGMVAQELAARAPASVQGLVLACTSAMFGKADGDWQRQFLAQRLAPLDAGLGMAGMADALLPGLVSPAAPAAARRIAREVMARVPEASYRAALAAIAGFDRRAALAALHMPVLLLAAEHDRTAPPDLMQRMAARIAGSEYLCLADAGHIANVEQPAAFNAALLDFLQRRCAGA
jgi:3-oxoadipate enol-lactonase